MTPVPHHRNTFTVEENLPHRKLLLGVPTSPLDTSEFFLHLAPSPMT